MSISTLHELPIKSMVLNRLRSSGEISQKSTIVSEFNIDNASRRVDLAIINDDKAIAIEIKSEADSLNRLANQAEKYLSFFDKLIVVVASKHLKNSLNILPEMAEVWEQSGEKLTIKRRGKINRINNKENLAKLMIVNDLKALLSPYKQGVYALKRQQLESRILALPTNLVRNAAHKSITKRYKHTSNVFWEAVVKRDIKPDDILLLSRFHDERISKQETERQRNLYWQKKSKPIFSQKQYIQNK